MHGEMRGKHRHHGEMEETQIKKWLSDEDKKKLAMMKLDMKIARVEQRLEYLKAMRELLKEKI